MTIVGFETPDDWEEAADEMDVSVAEYVRRMCRAGRRQFGYDHQDGIHTLEHGNNSDKNVVKEFVERNLSVETGHDQDDLVELISEDIAEAADELVEEGRAQYRHSEGGWIKVSDDE